MRESDVLRHIWLAVASRATLFRLNTGKAWVSGGGPVRRLTDGSVVVPFARPIALGLSKPNGDPVLGAYDLIGFTPVVITPDMVGKKVAVLTCIDAKNSDGGKVSNDQDHFGNVIRDAGGIAGIAHTPAVAQSLIFEYAGRDCSKMSNTSKGQ